ncbi:hypothetical protein BDZ89DRAFT_938738 [Hymenopellis radicata]|nr:hypothetical protein BDZ89DRAFT_938738 [Hymenopellis radicata]
MSTISKSPADASLSSQKISVPHIAELYEPNFLDLLLPKSDVAKVAPVTAEPDVPTNPLMEALKGTTNQTLTENCAPALISTLSAALDAFRVLTRYSDRAAFDEHLGQSWEQDSNLTLRIIWQLRSIHDGKSEKEAFYRAYSWLYDNHPRTAIGNLHMLCEPVCAGRKKDEDAGRSHGYWKDLLNILALATTGELQAAEPTFLHTPRTPRKSSSRRGHKRAKLDANDVTRVKVTTEENNLVQNQLAKEAKLATAEKRYETLEIRLKEPKYRALYIAVTRLFTAQLISDIATLGRAEAAAPGKERRTLMRQLSLAGKWAPTAGGSHDRHTNISTAICNLLYHSREQVPLVFPSMLQSADSSPRDKELTLRSWYKRWVMAPLRKALELPEPLMTSDQWTKIKYGRVASVCMKKNNEHFFKHDPDGFQKYMVDVESGKKTISGATLMPNEILAEVVKHNMTTHAEGGKYPQLAEFKRKVADNKLRVAEAQWLTLLGNIKDAGKLENSIAVCDVSGSMGGLGSAAEQPIMPALALSLILAHVAQPPFNNGFISFSATPQFIAIDPKKSLYDTVCAMVRSSWGMNTDFRAVFLNLLLPLAKKHNVKQEDMVKRLFVFSDMQFDTASSPSGRNKADWSTTYDAIEVAYKEAGYEVPQIVFWDLAAYGTTEVTAERKGVAMMNGFSPALLKVFMGEAEEEEFDKMEDVVGPAKEDEFNPINVLKKSVMKASFDGLVVMD